MSKGKDLKPHIGIFGRRNFGKSSIINVLTGQEVAIVSDIAGTTTDPVKKSVEIFGIGPAILIDTAGIDDFGDLGLKRVEKSLASIDLVDLAILVIANNTFGDFEQRLISRFNELETPFIILHNKSDIQAITTEFKQSIQSIVGHEIIDFSAKTKFNFEELIDEMRKNVKESNFIKPSLFDNIVQAKDLVLLITPIDSEAPEGRMILPQVMALRDALDKDALCMTVKETELDDFLKLGLKPKLSVTDSQVFGLVSKKIPSDWLLTSFSILFARLRGDFEAYLKGTPHLSHLKDGDKILLLESCTHHTSCEDIGRYKLPNWINKFSGKQLEYVFVPGISLVKEDLTDFALIIQCGGCMASPKQLKNRLKPAIDAGIPVSNYGLSIAYMNGIFERVIEAFTK